jgi:hypothetical protein
VSAWDPQENRDCQDLQVYLEAQVCQELQALTVRKEIKVILDLRDLQVTGDTEDFRVRREKKGYQDFMVYQERRGIQVRWVKEV